MKNVVIILIFLLISCSENAVQKNNEQRINQTEIQYNTLSNEGDSLRSVLQDRCKTEIIQYFNDSCTPAQVCDIWISKLNQVLTTGISDSMELMVTMIRDQISPDVYIDGSPSNVYFTDTFMNNWAINGMSLFDNTAGTLIFYTVYDYDPGHNIDIQNVGEGDCNCNRSSVFGACQFFGNDCDNDPCEDSSLGCGFIGAFRCNGVCDDVPKPSGHPVGTDCD